MPAVKLSPLFNDAQLDNNGIPLSGGQVYWYLSGTATLVTVYAESTGSVVNTNPVVLNVRGEPVSPIYLPTGSTYKAVLKDSNNSLIRTVEGISGINDVSVNSTISEWVLYSGNATFVSTTKFSVVGDATATFDNGRRIKTTCSGSDLYGTINGAPVYAAGVTTVTVTLDSGVFDTSISTVYYGFLDPAHPSFDTTGVNANTKAGIQGQTWVAFTTGGTSGTYTLTPVPAITAYAAGQKFNVTFNAASAATNTINVNGLGAKSIKMYSSTGSKIAAVFALNQISDIVYDGTDFVLLNTSTGLSDLAPITVSQAAGAMTVTLNPCVLQFRNANIASDTVTTLSVNPAISVTIPSTATLGTASGVANKLLVLAINNGGTVELAVCNAWNNTNITEYTTLNTTAISVAASSAVTTYSTTARTGVYCRVVGVLESTQTTAGTWASLPTIQSGGAWNPLQNTLTQGALKTTTSGTSIDMLNIPPWVKRITIMLNGISTSGSSYVQFQVGTGGTPTTSGYYSGATRIGGVVTNANSTTGLLTDLYTTAADTRTGIMILSNITGNNWVSTCTVASQGGSDVASVANGYISLAGKLDNLRLTTVGGTNTFDAGSFNILYE